MSFELPSDDTIEQVKKDFKHKFISCMPFEITGMFSKLYIRALSMDISYDDYDIISSYDISRIMEVLGLTDHHFIFTTYRTFSCYVYTYRKVTFVVTYNRNRGIDFYLPTKYLHFPNMEKFYYEMRRDLMIKIGVDKRIITKYVPTHSEMKKGK